MAGTAARCTSMTIAATAVENPVSCAIIRDPELIKKVYSDTNMGRYFVGEQIVGVRFRFADVAIYKAYQKGSYVSAAEAKMAGANTITTSGSSATADVVTVSLSHGIVTEAMEFESTNGEPIEYSITIMAARVSTNTGSVTVS